MITTKQTTVSETQALGILGQPRERTRRRKKLRHLTDQRRAERESNDSTPGAGKILYTFTDKDRQEPQKCF